MSENDWDAVGLTYGSAYTSQDREGKQSLNFLDQVTRSVVDYDATLQIVSMCLLPRLQVALR